MFSLVQTLLIAAFGATSVLSLTLNAPTSAQSGATTTITWTSNSTDSTFSIELFHPTFNAAIAIANNVDPSLNQIMVELPSVPPGDGYTIEAVNIANINQVFSTSADFSIAPGASSSLSSASATTASATAGSAVPSTSGSVTTGSATFPSAISPAPLSVATGSQTPVTSGAGPSAFPTSSAANLRAPFHAGTTGVLATLCVAFLAGTMLL
ncbi:hypothetical protein B0H11DRAFT_2071821 [Mycena galericulata]|nr:hypothetical protein B0H11DRAFT_2071821 [Mycena galericulata]